ncbi:MAG: hypothetical protein JW912_06220 [Sedimentisphaerales bacterium]|nr:hypothetical protein [Sedimentisphaerales bacterium]
MNDNKQDIEQYLKNIEFDDAPDHGHRDLLEKKLLLNFGVSGSRQNLLWRTIMNSKVTKFAAAAMIIAAVLVGMNLMTNTGSIALADVLEKVMGIHSYAYRVQTTSADVSDYSEFQMLISKDYGFVSKTYTPDKETGRMKLFGENYVVASEGIMISLIPEQKLFIEIKLDDKIMEAANQALKETGQDSTSPLLFIERFIENPYKELGTSYIDGVKVVGFESTDLIISEDSGRTEARLWVDAATELPLKIEAETYDQNGEFLSKTITGDFQWNMNFTQEDFIPVIPEDYKTLDDQLEFLGDEKSVIEGLRFYAKLFNGKYPETLAVKTLTLSNQVGNALRSGAGTMYAGKSEQDIMKEAGQGCMNLEFSTVFFSTLASENKAVAYYGDRVTAENPDAVLMRWREDNGRYMVIFGDLTVKRVSEEALAELEAMPLR